jgi:hypothetical protein
MNGSFICPNGGPHYFIGGDRCVCGATEGYVFTKRSEHERLTSDFAAAQALAESQRLALATMREALAWYADLGNYYDDASLERWLDDRGRRARKALTQPASDAAALAGAVLAAAGEQVA